MNKIKKMVWIVTAFLLALPFSFVSAAGGSGDNSEKLLNPVGVDTIEQFLNKMLGVVIKLGAVVAVFFVIYSGFLFVKARGNEDEIKKARETFLWTIVGVVVLLGAQIISTIITGTINDVTGAIK